MTEEDISFALRISCRYGRLTIGAPSSPIISNVLMYDYDQEMSQWSHDRNLVYTRYADDIFVSADQPGKLSEVVEIVREITGRYRFCAITVNDEKTTFLSRKYKRSITGLIVTPEGKISIGLQRKNALKKAIYAIINGNASPEDAAWARGMISFARDAEISFYETMIRKYGEDNIKGIENI